MKRLLLPLLLCIAAATAYGQADILDGMETNDQQLESKFRAVAEILSNGNFDALDQYIAADFVDHQGMPGFPAGLEGFKMMMTQMRKEFPDMKLILEEVIVHGNQVIGRYRVTGTHAGGTEEVPSINKKIDVQGVDWVRFEEGKVVEHWGFSEELKMMMQLGMMPAK